VAWIHGSRSGGVLGPWVRANMEYSDALTKTQPLEEQLAGPGARPPGPREEPVVRSTPRIGYATRPLCLGSEGVVTFRGAKTSRSWGIGPQVARRASGVTSVDQDTSANRGKISSASEAHGAFIGNHSGR